MTVLDKEFKQDGLTYRLVIYRDTFIDSPRKRDNLGTIVYNHSRYVLGDVEGTQEDVPSDSVQIKIYAYEHEGIKISTKPFSFQLDSDNVGIIYAEKEKILRYFNRKRISVKLIRQVMKMLKDEVTVFNQYINGDVYGYTISQIIECPCCGSKSEEPVDSCGGFYGLDLEDNGMYITIEEEYRDSVEFNCAMQDLINKDR